MQIRMQPPDIHLCVRVAHLLIDGLAGSHLGAELKVEREQPRQALQDVLVARTDALAIMLQCLRCARSQHSSSRVGSSCDSLLQQQPRQLLRLANKLQRSHMCGRSETVRQESLAYAMALSQYWFACDALLTCGR